MICIYSVLIFWPNLDLFHLLNTCILFYKKYHFTNIQKIISVFVFSFFSVKTTTFSFRRQNATALGIKKITWLFSPNNVGGGLLRLFKLTLLLVKILSTLACALFWYTILWMNLWLTHPHPTRRRNIMMMSCARPPVTSLKKQLTSVPKFARRKKTSSQCDQIKT